MTDTNVQTQPVGARKTVRALGWIVFLLSIVGILRQVLFILADFMLFYYTPSSYITVLQVVYILVSLVVSVLGFILGNKTRKDSLEDPQKTQKNFIYLIVLSIIIVIAEFIMFDDSLPIIPMLLVPLLVKGLVDARKIMPKGK